mmetsp:Transcript_27330/g.85002  ORF Transcript_27330/g.85002 Transcript_27330/m.85002 type:complete len:327 (-) Transcript_27330:120-1100(-)
MAAARLCALAAVAAAVSSKKKARQIQHLKEVRAVERSNMRAEKSSKKTMYHAIPSEWGAAGVRCHRPLSTSDDFVVALASDAADPVPIFAAINSTVSNTRRRALDVVAFVGPACELGLPTRAGETRRNRTSVERDGGFLCDADGSGKHHFGIRTARGDVVRVARPRRLRSLVKEHLTYDDSDLPPSKRRPELRVSVCGGLDDQLRQRPAMRALAMLRNSTRVKRKELLSAFNFAAFYLPHVLPARRILYLDTDVIVRGDVHELAKMALDGAPAAAVEDCSQHLNKYIDFPLADAYRAAAARRVRGRTFLAARGESNRAPRELRLLV